MYLCVHGQKSTKYEAYLCFVLGPLLQESRSFLVTAVTRTRAKVNFFLFAQSLDTHSYLHPRTLSYHRSMFEQQR